MKNFWNVHEYLLRILDDKEQRLPPYQFNAAHCCYCAWVFIFFSQFYYVFVFFFKSVHDNVFHTVKVCLVCVCSMLFCFYVLHVLLYVRFLCYACPMHLIYMYTFIWLKSPLEVMLSVIRCTESKEISSCDQN